MFSTDWLQDGETTTEIEPEGESHTTVDSAVLQEGERERASEELDDAANVEALLSDPSSELTPQIRAAIKSKWQKIVGPDTEIVVRVELKFNTFLVPLIINSLWSGGVVTIYLRAKSSEPNSLIS